MVVSVLFLVFVFLSPRATSVVVVVGYQDQYTEVWGLVGYYQGMWW